MADSDTSRSTLPPLLDNIEETLDNIETTARIDVSRQVDELRAQFRRIRNTPPGERSSEIDEMDQSLIALDHQLPQDSPARQWVQSILNRFEMYRKGQRDPSRNLRVIDGALVVDDAPVTPAAVQSETVSVRVTIKNDGEEAGAVARLEFLHDSGVPVRTVFLPMGTVGAGQTVSLETRVYVPSIAASYELDAVDPRDGQEFLVGSQLDAERSR